jgi:uncharacterized protein YkwD
LRQGLSQPLGTSESLGVRETPKLLTTTLLALCIVLAGILAGPAFARSPRSTHHHGARSGKGGHSRTHAKRRQRIVSHAKQKGTTKRTVSVHNKRSREAATRGLDAASSAAATIASVLATPCQNTELIPTSENLFAVRGAVLCLINRERAEHGIAPLTANVQLEEAAESHDAEMLADDYFEHIAPDGETPVDRIRQTGYLGSTSNGYVIGENLAWGTYQLATPQSIVEAWIASPGHLANILESRYTETGIGVTPAVPQSIGEGNPGATYAEEFGVIVH